MDVYPSLPYRDVEAALAFLEAAFGLEPVVLDDDGRSTPIRFAAVRHGDGMVMVQPELPHDLHGEHAGKGWVYVVVGDPDAHYARAKQAGAEVLGEPHDAMTAASAATARATRKATSGASGPHARSARVNDAVTLIARRTARASTRALTTFSHRTPASSR